MCSGVKFLLANLYICICGLMCALPADCCQSRVYSSLWIGWVYMLKGCINYWMGDGWWGGIKINWLSWIRMLLLTLNAFARCQTEIKDWRGGWKKKTSFYPGQWSMPSLLFSAWEDVRRIYTPRIPCSLYQLATSRWLLCSTTNDYISHVCEAGCLLL